MERNNWFFVCAVALCVHLLGTSDVQAYLDPGTGSMIIQMIVGSILAVLVTGRLYWQKVKNFFRGTKEEPAKDEKEDTTETESKVEKTA